MSSINSRRGNIPKAEILAISQLLANRAPLLIS
jgi:hypothetical protein